MQLSSFSAIHYLFERGISSEDILHILTDGEIIEEYEDDAPCPSFLMLGYLRGIAHHVVVGCCADHIKKITVYHPDESCTNDRFRR
ncbi:DUF4258 domain-containing protein [Methanospirillum lacunae]|uniref:DUF4258 domain-containing protein n=1 Tax=Methanospirillum lacunae TaxID=668570 RepID=UPI0038FC7686